MDLNGSGSGTTQIVNAAATPEGERKVSGDGTEFFFQKCFYFYSCHCVIEFMLLFKIVD
jgi:hypothetical protein